MNLIEKLSSIKNTENSEVIEDTIKIIDYLMIDIEADNFDLDQDVVASETYKLLLFDKKYK